MGWRVLNLIITGMPSILFDRDYSKIVYNEVLNLIITGMPSILNRGDLMYISDLGFKPYYNWNAFNT